MGAAFNGQAYFEEVCSQLMLDLPHGFFRLNLPGCVHRVSVWVLLIMTANVNLVSPPTLSVVEKTRQNFLCGLPSGQSVTSHASTVEHKCPWIPSFLRPSFLSWLTIHSLFLIQLVFYCGRLIAQEMSLHPHNNHNEQDEQPGNKTDREHSS